MWGGIQCGVSSWASKKPSYAYNETYKLLNSSLCHFLQVPLISPQVGPHILLSILFSNTLSFSPKHVTKFHANFKQIHKITVLNILIPNSLNRAVESQILWTERYLKTYRVKKCKISTRLLFISLYRGCKGKAIPLQAWRGLEGSRRLRLPHFKTISTWSW